MIATIARVSMVAAMAWAATGSASAAVSQARLAGLFDPANRTENFRQMDQILPFRPIPTATPMPLPRRLDTGPASYTWNGATKPVEVFLRENRVVAFIVVRKGVVVREWYGLGAGPQDRFTSWSMAKSVLSTLVGIALAEGRISSIDDPVKKYAPQFADTAYADVPLRDLLTMSSGIAWNDDTKDPNSDTSKLLRAVYFQGDRAGAFVGRSPRRAPAGTVFNYGSADPQVLAAVLSNATGSALSDYLSQKIWRPLGASAEGYWNLDRDGGAELGACCISARLDDYARFGAMLANGGAWRDRQVVPSEWIAAASRPGRPGLEPGKLAGENGYGYLWWIPPSSQEEFFADGLFGQVLWIDQKHKTAVVMLADDVASDAHLAEEIALMRALTNDAHH